MHTYIWKAIDKTGNRLKGKIHAKNISLAKCEINKRRYKTISIKKKIHFNLLSKRIKPKNTTLFYKHLKMLLSSNIPISDALLLLEKANDNKLVDTQIKNIRINILSGSSFSEAISTSSLSNAFITGIIDNAEKNGSIERGLGQIVKYLEKINELKTKIKKALSYPVILSLSTLLIFSFMLGFIVPQFEKLFATYNSQLPFATRLLIKSTHWINEHLIQIAAFFLSFISLLYYFYRTKKQLVDKLILKLPMVGKFKIALANANIFRTLSTSTESNTDIIFSLKNVVNFTNNHTYTSAIKDIITDINKGQSIHSAFQKHALFKSIDIQAIAIAETTGNLTDTFNKLSENYEEDIDTMINKLDNLLAPLAMLVLGIFIGGFILTIYLPLFKMGSIF